MGSFPGLKRPERDVDYSPYLAPVFLSWLKILQRAKASSLSKIHDHIQVDTTIGMTPLDE
jgi:hypothetical protein